MFNQYPYTDFHELNLDYILDLCRRTMGLHLETSGDFLKLVNQAGDDISKLKITYADKALTDMDGHDIRAFILDAGVDGRRLVFDRGNGEYVSITVPYATSAEQDVNGVAITDYVKGVSVSGDNVLITFGNGATTAITVPFATKASQDTNGKALTTYVAELSTGNDKLIVRDGDGVTLTELTIPYAVKARDDYDGDDIRTTYGTDLTIGQTTVILRDKETNVLSEITVPYAVSAQTDNNGAPFRSSYGASLATGSNKVQLTAPNGTVLSDITVPFATVSTDATNAIESVSVSGDNIVFTTFGGQSFSITCPYAVKALKDDLNNTLSHTYIANAVNDPLTGKITFYAQDGAIIAEMTPTVDRATHDNLGNDIADYIKTIVTDPNSNYVTVTHGDGTSDSLTINYATKAWKDTYGNVIGNVYIRSLSIITDSNTGKKVLVAYNGELSELFRIDIDSETAVNDVNGTPITDYVTDVSLNGNDLDIEHGDGTVDTIPLPTGGAQDLDDLTDVNISSPTNGQILTYDSANTEWVNTNAPVIPSVPDDLNDLNDVNISTPTNGQILTYDSVNTEWVNTNAPVIPTVPDDLNDLNDVSLTSPIDGNVLMYDGNSNEWVNGVVPSGVTTLAGLSDVDVSSVGNNDILRYDANDSEWKPDVNAIGSLSGVSFSGTAVDGEAIVFDSNSNAWTNKPVLNDVNITTPANGDMLVYDSNAGEWVNMSGQVANVTYNEVSVYDPITPQTISHEFATRLGTLGIGSGGIQNWYNAGSLQDIVDHGNAYHYTMDIDNLNFGRRHLPHIAEYTRVYNASTQTWVDVATLVGAIAQMLETPTVYTQLETTFYFANSTTAFDKLVLTANSTDTHFTFGSFTTVTDIYS